MKRKLTIIGLLALTPLAFAAGLFVGKPRTATYENRELGFRITAPEFKPFTLGVGGTMAVLLGPAERGGAPSVSVVMHSTDNIDEQIKAARESLEMGGAKVLRANKTRVGGREASLIEAEGTIGGAKKHALTLSVFRETHTLMVTCSAGIEQYAELKATFEACLESLTLDDAPGK
ncbi:hypothetical protein RAS1_12980 [Phycisphaerae bacterium RAS1]|nr:hypothetical protein RAS1_12980 [Phycisphaerae bacterium RAS1]